DSDKDIKRYRGLMQCQQVTYDEKTSVLGRLFGSSKFDNACFWTTTVAGNNYATFVQYKHALRVFEADWRKDEEEVAGNGRYEVAKDQLRSWGLDEQLVAKAVDAGKLKGRVERTNDKEKTVTKVSVPEKGDGIRAFIKGGGELFTKEPGGYPRAKIVPEK